MKNARIELDNRLEEGLADIFQRKVRVVRGGEELASGRFILYTMRGFDFVLILKTDGDKMVRFPIPRPFNYTKYDGKIVCDYRIETLAAGVPGRITKLRGVRAQNASRFLGGTTDIYFGV